MSKEHHDTAHGRQTAAAAAMPAGVFHGLMVLLLSMYSLGTALILPTLPMMRTALPGMAASWMFAAVLLGFGATQLAWGTLADRRGRRQVLLSGLCLLTLASVGCLLAAQAWQLLALRFAQGAGIAAAGVCARAMVRDRYTGEQSVRILAQYFTCLGAVGLAGPWLAGYLIAHRGHGAALWAFAAVAGGAWLLVWTCMPRGAGRMPPQPGAPMAGDWPRIARHPVFRMYTALTACSYLGHYLFLTQSAFLLIDHFHWNVADYGGVLSLCSLFYMGGTWYCRRAMPRIGLQRLVGRASLIGLAGAGGMLASAVSNVAHGSLVVLPYMLFVFAHGVHQSCGQAAAMAPFRNCAAQASGLLGTLLPFFAVGCGWLLMPASPHGALALPLAVGAAAVATAAIAWHSIRRHGAISGWPD